MRVIRASELGTYAFCQRAWWLQQVAGQASANTAELAAGSEAHAAHGRSVGLAGLLRLAAYGLALAGLVWGIAGWLGSLKLWP